MGSERRIAHRKIKILSGVNYICGVFTAFIAKYNAGGLN